MSSINLKGFCFVQEEVWLSLTKRVENELKCLKCSNSIKMISKWKAECIECKTKHTIKKPKSFPKNSNNTNNWKATCDECGAKMDFHKGGAFGAYICRKCNNILEV